jgi:hypothetical protein
MLSRVSTTRLKWGDIAADVRPVVEDRTGPIRAVHPVDGGFNSHLAVRLDTDRGSVFVKGLRSDHPQAWTQQREAAVSRYTAELGPRLLWHAQEAGWDLLGFDFVEGHHADYAANSPDINLLADTLTQLATIKAPPVILKKAEERWAGYVDDTSILREFSGNTLCHTDFNPENVLIIPRQNRAIMVDWAWSTAGAAWIDPALCIVWLIATGHRSPEAAESWARRMPAWNPAPVTAVDASAAANGRLWASIAADNPGSWSEALRNGALMWSAYRRTAAG